MVASALDPSSVEYLGNDTDSVSLARKLQLDLQKTASYIEGTNNADTIDYAFEVSGFAKEHKHQAPLVGVDDESKPQTPRYASGRGIGTNIESRVRFLCCQEDRQCQA